MNLKKTFNSMPFWCLVAAMAVSTTFSSCKKEAKEGEGCCGAEECTEAVTETKALTIAEITPQLEALTDKDVTIEGRCIHICQHSGTKMMIMGANENEMLRITSTEALGKFDTTMMNQTVVVEGIVREQRIDEEYLKNWEAELAEAGETEEHHVCETEKKADKMESNTVQDQINEYRTKINERNAAEGKAYISNFSIEAKSYKAK